MTQSKSRKTNVVDDTGVFKSVVSKADALDLIKAHASSILILELVSDYYADPISLDHRKMNPIPGFLQISSDSFEEEPMWNLKSDATMIKVLEEYGIVPNSEAPILLFDNIQIEYGFVASRFDASARIYSVLKYFGLKHVSIVMDHELTNYFADEFAVDHPEVVQRMAANTQGTRARWPEDMLASAPLGKDTFVSEDTLLRMIAGELGSYRLLDARSAEEHAGEFTGYDYIPVAGKIPTSESIVNGDYQLSQGESLADVLGRLQDTFNKKAILKTDYFVWYCGTGWRAARMFALSHALGYMNVGVYDGGWNEWHQHHPE